MFHCQFVLNFVANDAKCHQNTILGGILLGFFNKKTQKIKRLKTYKDDGDNKNVFVSVLSWQHHSVAMNHGETE